MTWRNKIRTLLIGKALEKCRDPFEEGRIIVMLNFSVFMFLSNLPYTFITMHGMVWHFVSAVVQDVSMLTVIILLNRGFQLRLARDIFFANFFLQNLYHFVVNNGAAEALEQGVLFTILIIIFAFTLYGSTVGWMMFMVMGLLLVTGIYNGLHDNALVNFPAEFADPMMADEMLYMILFPIAMNVYLVSEFVRAQGKARKRIYEQNHLLAEKNREITDSINYAKKIQEAILPSQEKIDSLLPNSFIFYRPKDIVAGDFYFLDKEEGMTFIAAADCTGHGVPGAMLSVMCSNALRSAVAEQRLRLSGEILDQARDRIISGLSGSAQEMKDGMDISFCALDLQKKKLWWSGANNPLWLIRAGELLSYKGDKQPVGRHFRTERFTTHEIVLLPGDVFYLFTDGFQDQFGGEKEKKFTVKKLKETLLAIHHLEPGEQQRQVEKTFIQWKGQYDQVDDVCLIGIRIT